MAVIDYQIWIKREKIRNQYKKKKKIIIIKAQTEVVYSWRTTGSSVVQGFQNEDGSFTPRRRMLQEGLEDQEGFQIEWPETW